MKHVSKSQNPSKVQTPTVLAIQNLAFLLPVGFKGDFSDALRHLARYCRVRKRIKQKKQPTGRITKKTWDAFLDILDKGGRLAAVASIQHWNEKKWIHRKLDSQKR